MAQRYFRLEEEVTAPGRWYLDDPVSPSGADLDPWQFTLGEPVHVAERLRVPIYRPGEPLDFSMAGVGITPLIHERLASLFLALAADDVQLLPVGVEARPEGYFVLNVTRVVKCIDEEASEEVQYWQPEDGQPDKVGEYRSVYGLRIDPTRVGTAQVFRPWGWPVALLVSEALKEALERARATGVKFTEV